MGHSSITITIDRYGNLYPGARAEAAAMLDRLLDAAPTARQEGITTRRTSTT